ncbi:Zinc finger C3HC4 type (RING finger) RING like zinc finger RING type zinc finger Ring finger domain [Trypanosoma vivax]|uniref:RING-type domain-containing protein n=1 Tax=Trypanosoma vivax (strain Y486) TaxID=1055687 RepID=G0U2L2_TRYVY|nr:hypothetical protein TRVL_04776 [Trypanosoma vivax]KAH8604227.1 Zinc finger C3HC4 type (RING finger) RING like zinc finger RING type zinc finger Ring finger domain [Trypanosoma vivax]CCC50515.1 conserved hypothetical protein [Trypanosoma vivax Y486]
MEPDGRAEVENEISHLLQLFHGNMVRRVNLDQSLLDGRTPEAVGGGDRIALVLDTVDRGQQDSSPTFVGAFRPTLEGMSFWMDLSPLLLQALALRIMVGEQRRRTTAPLEQEAIGKLRRLTLCHDVLKRLEVAGQTLCSICQETFAPATDVYHLPCGHVFDVRCMEQWFEQTRTCPNCRFMLQNVEEQYKDATVPEWLDMETKEEEVNTEKNFPTMDRSRRSSDASPVEDTEETMANCNPAVPLSSSAWSADHSNLAEFPMYGQESDSHSVSSEDVQLLPNTESIRANYTEVSSSIGNGGNVSLEDARQEDESALPLASFEGTVAVSNRACDEGCRELGEVHLSQQPETCSSEIKEDGGTTYQSLHCVAPQMSRDSVEQSGSSPLSLPESREAVHISLASVSSSISLCGSPEPHESSGSECVRDATLHTPAGPMPQISPLGVHAPRSRQRAVQSDILASGNARRAVQVLRHQRVEEDICQQQPHCNNDSRVSLNRRVDRSALHTQASGGRRVVRAPQLPRVSPLQQLSAECPHDRVDGSCTVTNLERELHNQSGTRHIPFPRGNPRNLARYKAVINGQSRRRL